MNDCVNKSVIDQTHDYLSKRFVINHLLYHHKIIGTLRQVSTMKNWQN